MVQRYVFSVNDLTIAVEQSRNLTWNDLTVIASAIFLFLWLVILVASFGFPLSCALEIKISLKIFDINRILNSDAEFSLQDDLFISDDLASWVVFS